ncbi:hypothetical protein HYPSUDRAFT_444198 [Hypholoma sublateritium FD-334 SS-4]|uniref:Uncharacterized protein n=1 Tax=Hypholoma sublateritium (strain FD-334 SS-4) TaxID=945553 RepID=A0A0D2NCW3_HYPSF|nr:hypothetical protein HYPSUDRAFT_444198 [Hypholoma sublateritium FD-334 SS-4]
MIHILPPVFAPDKGTFLRLNGLLEHPLCTFASSVRELSIFDPYQKNTTTLDSSWIDLLVTQLDRLVFVNSLDLTLSDEAIMVYCDAVILKAPSFASLITRLTLRVCDLPESQEAMQWMSKIFSFRSLTHLTLIQDDYEDGRERVGEEISIPTTAAVLPMNLRVLRITSWETNGILPLIQLMLKWLYKSQTQISTLEFGFISMQYSYTIKTPPQGPPIPWILIGSTETEI